jgi:predicted small lipoprotein YifL
MSVARTVTYFVALVSLAAALAGCGQVGYPGAVPPAHTQTYRTETASPLPAGVDAMTGLQQRPMRPPTLAANETCSASSQADLGAVAPNYGAGVGPAYMSGQDSWYSGGQVAILMVDSQYSGPLLVRAFQLGGDGKSTVTLADLPAPDNANVADKERQHGVAMVSALHTTGGGLYLGAVAPTSFWRAWFGRLATDSPGCFGLQVDGDVFTEFIVFAVNPGTPPPG